MNLGREKTGWSQEIWNRIDQAVHDEAERTKIAAKFLPMYGPVGEALTVPADRVHTADRTLMVRQNEVEGLLETFVEFALTPQQVERVEEDATAITLATRAANLLAQGQDLLIFRGRDALRDKLFTGGDGQDSQSGQQRRNGPVQLRLLAADPPDEGLAAILTKAFDVLPVDKSTKKYGEHTAEEVAKAYAHLQDAGHYGPYAVVLFTDFYADAYSPLASTLILPADKIKPLATAGFYGTGTLPDTTGLVVSLGGNSMDLAVGNGPTAAFMTEDREGLYRFRVFERFVLRLKDPTAVVRLEFKK